MDNYLKPENINEIVTLIFEGGMSIKTAAKTYSVEEDVIKKWLCDYEVKQLRDENRRLKILIGDMELKKWIRSRQVKAE
tara:strand:- start:69 stop:305 length:237 start_codon:yes stop_codon:yes gene_type:complete